VSHAPNQFISLSRRCTNCGTRKPSRWYANRPTFCISSQKHTFTAMVFTYRVLLINFCIFVCFSCWFSQIVLIISHSNFRHVAFLSMLVFQTFERIIWKIEFSWSKVVRGDSTGPTNGSRSEKVKKFGKHLALALMLHMITRWHYSACFLVHLHG